MKLKVLGANQTEIEIGFNKILFSYETPVVIFNNESGRIFHVTDKGWSRSTGKHIASFF